MWVGTVNAACSDEFELMLPRPLHLFYLQLSNSAQNFICDQSQLQCGHKTVMLTSPQTTWCCAGFNHSDGVISYSVTSEDGAGGPPGGSYINNMADSTVDIGGFDISPDTGQYYFVFDPTSSATGTVR